MRELLHRPATELAAMVRSGEISSRDLVEASLRQIDEVDGEVNAFTLTDADGALAAADAIGQGDERPFAGVPMAVKDLGVAVTGMRLTQGMELMGDYVPDYDAYVARRLKEAGFVLIGRTNTPELGILPVTEPRRFGPTRNPWDLERTPGGSSGGSAAAVAAGMVPVAHASDGGGSIRIPAACCGLVGLKPARGRISRGPDLGDHFLATDGAVTRTVADTAAMLDVLAGYELGDATWAPPPAEPFAATAAREPGPLRIAIAYDPPVDVSPSPAALEAVRQTGELLESLGHHVTELSPPPWKGVDLLPLFTQLWAGVIGIGVPYAQLLTGNEPSQDNLEPLTWDIFQMGLAQNSLEYAGAIARLQAVARGLVQTWREIDVLMTPALAQRPVRIGDIDSCGENPMYEFKKSGEFTPYTALFNVTGQPAITLPLYQGDDGLPLAVQLAGPPVGEGLLLSLSAQLEAACPWGDRVAPLAAQAA